MVLVDPRLEMARRAQQGSLRSNNVVTLRDMLAKGQAVPQGAARSAGQSSLEAYARQKFSDSQSQAEAERIAKGAQLSARPGGFKGALADVLENRVVKSVLKPLSVIDIPRRVVISGIHEISDAVGSGDASWSDFTSQVKDQSYGVGRYVHTGNKWVDRGLGFVGDVALDPVTYLTLGAGHAAGASGRLSLAGKMLEAGYDAERVAEVARIGKTALSAVERADLGVNRAGFYFFGKRLPAVRIPGSGGVASMTEKGLTGLRLTASDLGLGKFLSGAFTPNVNKAARLAVLRGELPAGEAAKVIRVILSRDTQRAAEGAARAASSSELDNLVTLVTPEFRATGYQVLDGAREATPAEQQLAEAVRGWFDAKHGSVTEAMNSVDKTGGFGKIEDGYFPWMQTPKAREYMGNPNSSYLGDLKKGFDDGDPLSVFQTRMIAARVKGGETVNWFGHKLTTEDLNVDRLNELARAGGFEGNFFETDLIKVLESYANQHAQQMGLAARYGDLKKAGVLDVIDNKLVRVESFDPQAVAAQAERVKTFAKEHAAAHAAALDAVAAVKGELGNISDGMAARIKAIGAQQFDAAKASLELRPQVEALSATLQKANAGLEASYAQLHRLFDGAAPEIGAAFGDGTKRAQLLVMGLDAKLSEQIGQLSPRGLKDLQATADSIGKQITEMSNQSARMVEFNDVIARNWDRIVQGQRVGDKYVNDIGMALGLVPQTAAFQSKAGKLAEVSGEFQRWAKSELTKTDWWGRVSGTARTQLAPANVAAMTAAEVEKTIINAASSGTDIGSLRNAAAWMLARDEKFYGKAATDAPLATARENLLAKLEKAAEADDLSRRLAAVETRDLASIQRKSVQLNVDASELEYLTHQANNDIEAIRQAREILRLGEVSADGGTMVLDEAMKARLRQKVMDISSKDYTVGQGASARSYKLKDFRDIAGPAQSDLRNLSERFTFSPEDAKRWRELGSPGKVKAELADVMHHYYTVSDIQYRFNLAARTMAWSGLVPSEAMMRSAVEASAKKWVDHWDSRMAQLVNVQTTLKDLRAEWSRRAPLVAGKPGATADELRKMFDEAFRRDGGEALRQFMGPALAGAEDPKVMLQRIGSTTYRNDVIKPWYEANFGKWQNVDAAKVRLREMKAAGRSPFSVGSTLEDVNAFFADIIGGPVRNVGASARAGGATVRESGSWMRSMPGTLWEEFKRTEAQQRVFHSLIDPNVDVNALVQGGGIGSFYADSLKRAADSIDQMSASKVHIPEGTPRDLVAAARKDVDTLKRRMQSVDYEIAMANEDLHQGIMELARYDLWRAARYDGRPGFFLPNGRQVLDGAGAPLAFTKEETNSLYRSVMSEADSKLVRSKLGSLGNQLGQARKELEALVSSPRYQRFYEARPYLFPQKAELEQRVATLSDELATLRSEALSSLPQTQSAALAKARILINGDGETSWVRLSPNADFITPSPLTVAARKEGQAAAHAASPSRQFLNEIDALNQSATVKAWRGWASNTVAVRQHTDTMRAVAAAKEAEIAGMQLALKPVNEAIPLAAKRQRAYELMLSLGDKQNAAKEAAILDAKAGRQAATELADTTSEALKSVQARYDSARSIVEDMTNLQNTTVPRLQEKIDQIGAVIDKHPADKADAVDWLNQTRTELDSIARNPDDPISKVLSNAISMEVEWLSSSQKLAQAQSMLNDLQRGSFKWETVPGQAADGWKAMGQAGLPGLQAPEEIGNMLLNMQRIEQPAFARVVNQLFGGYTRFFKTYATLSPGFHVRNALSNMFMILASGADPRALHEGWSLWRGLHDAVKTGRPFEEWLAEVPEAQRGFAEIAMNTMFGSGGGHSSDQLKEAMASGMTKLVDNKVTRASQKVGNLYESSSRFMLAYDSAKSGLDFHQSMAKVKTYLFDYRDISTADENMRAIVPFWIWMSRNLPLQIMNQWTNPRAYSIYASFMRNFGQPSSGSDIKPSWLVEQGGVKIGEDLYLRPDLGFNRLSQQIAEVGDLPRLMSYMNPALRVPMEVLGGRQFYNNVPFSDKPQPVAAGPLSGPLGMLANLIGEGQKNAQGQTVVDPRFNYALKNLNPLIAQGERLLPATSTGKDRQLNSLVGWLGAPVTQVTQSMKDSELYRRQKEIDMMAKARQNLGFKP